MKIRPVHRRAAGALWEAGGCVDEAARSAGVRPNTVRRWLAAPAFRAMLAEGAAEPLLQATSAVLRWAPAAVARLIRELDGDSSASARQAARELLKLALEARREIARVPTTAPVGDGGGAAAGDLGDDPFSQRVAHLSAAQLERVLGILNEKPEGAAAAEAPPAEGGKR